MSLALTRVNDDSSWLVELDGTRLLLDPWFGGPAVVFLPPISEAHLNQPTLPPEAVLPVDAVVLSHAFPDHLHRRSLQRLPADLPCYAPLVALPWARLQSRFQSYTRIPNATAGESAAVVGEVELYNCRAAQLFDTTHNALVLKGRQSGTSVMYCPHGMLLGDRTMAAVERVTGGRPDVLLCSFSMLNLPFWLGGLANMGAEPGRSLLAHLRPPWVFHTHDGDKRDTGLVAAVSTTARAPALDSLVPGPEVRTAPSRVGERWTLPSEA